MSKLKTAAETAPKPDPTRHLLDEHRLSDVRTTVTRAQLMKVHMAEKDISMKWKSWLWIEANMGIATNELYALFELFELPFIQLTRSSARCVSLPALVYLFDTVPELCQKIRYANDSEMFVEAKAEAKAAVRESFKKQFEAEFEKKMGGDSNE